MSKALIMALSAAFAATLASPIAAAPKDIRACVAAAEDAQRLRADGKLRAARERLIACASEDCPVMIQKDCQKWLEQVDAGIPTVVIAAIDEDGRDVVDLRVVVDGTLLAARYEGRTVEVDPGLHVLRVEADGRHKEERLMIREGEKDRLVRVVLPRPLPAPPASAPPQAPAPLPPEQTPPPSRALTYATGGLAVAALGAFALFAIEGIADRSALGACKPSCTADRIDVVHREFIVADVALIVGALAAGAFTWLVLNGAKEPRRSALRF